MQATVKLTDSMAQAFFEMHPHAVLVLDAAGRVLNANPAAATLAPAGNYPTFAQLTGLMWPESSHGHTGVHAGWNRRLRVQTADGAFRQFDASLFAANAGSGQLPVFYLVLRDVTASVQAARGLQEVESRSRVTSDSAPVLVWMAGADTLRDWFNKS